MADLRRRSKSILRWCLTAAIVVYAIGDWGEPAAPTSKAAPSDEPGATSELRITSISDADVNPGDAVVVRFDGAVFNQPITAKIAKQPADVVVTAPGSVVVRVPPDAPLGKAGMRLVQGERKSKSWDLHIRATNHRKLIARLLGGLALFVYGLSLLAGGFRGLAGQRVRSALGSLTRSPPKALGVGVLVGGLTQLTSSAAALVVGLVQARMLALGAAVAVLVGAQLGASITGALLPVALARESLLVIAIGVMWTRLSTGRSTRAFADLVLGIGLMLYGVHLLQTSVEPLVSDPKLLPYLDELRGESSKALFACATGGALLAIALQGPGPVYVLVVGLVHASGALPLTSSLAILLGTNVGAGAVMAAIVWQSGPATRPLAIPHLGFGAVATLTGLVGLPLWTRIGELAPGGGQPVALALGFGAAQIAVTVAWLAVLPALARRVIARPRAEEGHEPPRPDALAMRALRELGASMARLRGASEVAVEIACSGERTRAAECDDALGAARKAIEQQYAAVTGSAATPSVERSAGTAVATLQLQRVVEQLVQVAELGVERGLKLTEDEQARLRAMHQVARESFDALVAALESGTAPDLEQAGAREIRMNQLEAAGRVAALVGRRRRDTATTRLGISELIDAYEHVGNHLFRIAKTLDSGADELG